MAENPVLNDWQRALVGQFPQHQAFPPNPGQNALENFVRSLLSNTLNMPQTAMAALQYPLIGSQAPGTPTAVAPGGPAAPVGPITLGPQFRSPASTPVPGSMGTTLLSTPMPTLPAPVLAGPPPQMAAAPPSDLNAVRNIMALGAPGPIDAKGLESSKFAGILSGMASGAGSVDATQPGSFAKALAMWGAGGAGGMKEGIDKKLAMGERQSERTSQFQQNRASQELQLQQLQHNQAQQVATINFENAKANYQTTIANQKMTYEHQLQKFGMEVPKITHNAQGIMIQQLDPRSGQQEVKFIDTTPTMQRMEQTAQLIKASGMPGGEGLKLRMIDKEWGNQPLIADQMYRRAAVDEVFERGAGGAVFGKFYTDAVEAAKKEVLKEGIVDPKMMAAALQDRIKAKILPRIALDNEWIKRAAPHSFTAGVIMNSAAPPPSGTRP